MARFTLSVCFMSMLVFSTRAMPSRAQLSQKTTIAERIIREEYQHEALDSREMAELRNAEIRAGILDQSLRNLKLRNMRMPLDTAPREYLESREADHGEAIIKRHHTVSRTFDFRGRSTMTTGPPHPSQVPALLELRAALLPADGIDPFTSWDINNNCENWLGLTCNNNRYVTAIFFNLYNNSTQGLSGSIPDSIGNLTSLTYLQLTNNNNLTGSIPDSIGNLTSLTYLYFYGNNLTGSIPDSIGNLTSLTHLDLNGNNLTGSIPYTIGNLTSLTHLVLHDNNLTGSIPDTIGNLTSVIILVALHKNNLTGSIPDSIGNLKSLIHLYLYGNQLMGSIPLSIGNLTSLNYLQLTNNKLTGSIPDSIGNMTSLIDLQLNGNQLTGSIPVSIGNMTSLTDIFFQGNNLTGSIPGSIGNLTSLIHLYLYGNQLTGSIPLSIGNMTSLTVLALDDNYLKGDTVTAFRRLSSTKITIDQNCLSNVINQKDAHTCELYAYGVSLISQVSTCGGTSNATLDGTPVQGRYYFFSVSVGSIYTSHDMQPNNATITITHSVTGLPGYNGSVNLDGAIITFTDSVLTPTLIRSGGQWLLSLPNNDSNWKIPVFGGGSLWQVLDAAPSNLSYSFSMTSNNVDVLGVAWLLSMVQYDTPIVASPPLPNDSDYNYLQITPRDNPHNGYFSGQPTNSSTAVNFPYPGNFVSFDPTYTAMYNSCNSPPPSPPPYNF